MTKRSKMAEAGRASRARISAPRGGLSFDPSSDQRAQGLIAPMRANLQRPGSDTHTSRGLRDGKLAQMDQLEPIADEPDPSEHISWQELCSRGRAPAYRG